MSPTNTNLLETALKQTEQYGNMQLNAAMNKAATALKQTEQYGNSTGDDEDIEFCRQL